MSNGRLVLVRHGETAWSRSGRHTGRTDVALTPLGEDRARALAPRLAAFTPALVLASPLVRAQETARLAGLRPETDPALLEWDYGVYEGRTTADIRAELGDPGWTIWSARDGLGESADQVGERVARVLTRCTGPSARGDVVLVAHAHVLRILTAVWLGLSADRGRSFVLDPAGIAVLGHERENPVITAWNV
jgi:probable phosphoglycerate mutase